MGPTRTAFEECTTADGDWFVSWLRSFALATSSLMVCGFVVAAVTDLSRVLVAIPPAIVWALAAIALAHRDPAGGAAAAVAGPYSPLEPLGSPPWRSPTDSTAAAGCTARSSWSPRLPV